MIPTPSLSHLTKHDFRSVYEPAEDSFILLDALEADAETLTSSLANKAPICVEIGSGSGIVTTFISQILGPTCIANGVQIEPVRTSLLSGLRSRLNGQVDVLLFNPPYVPTEEEEEMMAQGKGGIEGSWAGGETGTKLVDELIDGGIIFNILAQKGRFYLVAIKQNNPVSLVKRLLAQGLDADVVLARRAGGEHLHIIRAIKP